MLTTHSERCQFANELWEFYIGLHEANPYNPHNLKVDSAAWFDIARLLAKANGATNIGTYGLSLSNKALQLLRQHAPMLRQKVKVHLGV